jgi:hypothetical protein
MSGIGGDLGGKLATIQVELPDTVDGIMDAVRRIILLGSVHTITLRHDAPIIYQRLVQPGESAPTENAQSFAELTPLEVVRNIHMEEWEGEPCSPSDQIIWMFLDMSVRRWTVTHILLSANTGFWKWLHLPDVLLRGGAIEQFLGAKIEFDEKLSGDVFILCGARTKQATIAEIGFALKGNMIDG